MELPLMLLSPWVCYLITDMLQLSGIVAILTNGIFLNIYATPNVSTFTKDIILMAYEGSAYYAESLVFVFLGIGLFAFDHPFD